MSELTATKNVTDSVAKRVKALQNSGDLHLPANYSPNNALKSAYLILQETVDRNKKPVLESCTQTSIANCLLDMIVQGLNPAKKQCYFIAYGAKLTLMRSYHGSKAIVKSICGAKEVSAQVVWGGDDFEYTIDAGNKNIVFHKQKLQNVGKDPIGAYCVISFATGSYTDIMTIDQIKKSWTKSKMSPSSDSSTHSQFTEEMIKRTVINRACKHFINSSSDSALLLETVNKEQEFIAESELKKEIEEKGNKEIIDIEPVGGYVEPEFEAVEIPIIEEKREPIETTKAKPATQKNQAPF